jgi:hypothetical protein
MSEPSNANGNNNEPLAQPNHVAQLEASQQVKTIVVQQIPISLIRPNPKNRLITQDAIDAMAESLDRLVTCPPKTGPPVRL